MQAQKLIEDYKKRRVTHFETAAAKRRAQDEARVSPRNPVASNVNFDCGREMYLGITAWQKRPVLSVESQERMADGDVASAAAQQRLRDMGYQVVETEGPMQPFRNRAGKVVYTGRIDCKVVFDGHKVPAEIKDPGEYVYEAIDTYADLDRFWWTRKWKGQILVYLLQNNEPSGVLILYCQGRMKMVPIVLEEQLEDAETALALGESVVAAVAKGTPPPFAKDPTVCRKCWAFGIACNPPIEEQGAAMLDADGELYEQLVIAAESEEAHRRYEAAKKRRNEILKAIVPAAAFANAKPKDTFFRGICGEFGIALTKRARKGYVVKDTEYQEAEVVRAAAKREEVA